MMLVRNKLGRVDTLYFDTCLINFIKKYLKSVYLTHFFLTVSLVKKRYNVYFMIFLILKIEIMYFRFR